MPDAPKKDEKKKGIFGRIKGWFKDAADWIQEHLGDPGLAREIRADLRLKAGEDIKETDLSSVKAHAGALDPDKEGFAETVTEVAAVATDIMTLSKTMTSPGQDAANVSYMLMKLGAADSVRIRVPFLYAIAQLLLFVGDDPESMEALDPAKLVHLATGDDLPSFEAWAQRWTTMIVVGVELLDRLLADKLFGEEALVAFYGWDPSPDNKTPLADLVSTQALTLDIRARSGTGGRLLTTMLLVPAEHGGPGVFLSLGGDLIAEQVISGTKYSLNVGVPGALDLFIPRHNAPLPF